MTSPPPSGAPAVLYLSYDGMTDPLGQSQVIPYLVGLAREGYRIHLVSFEKPERFAAGRARIAGGLASAGIEWHPLPYTRRPPVLSTVRDVVRMRRLVARLHARHRFELVHCRSYVAALAGLALRERHGVKLVFDMRGFWPDERVDGGTWKLANPLFRAVYTYFKGMEKRFVSAADGIVVLTEAARDEMRGWDAFRASQPPTRVIPCSVDLELFRVPEAGEKERAKAALGLAGAGPVLAYLGSLGTWYMVDEMADFFAALRRRHTGARFLVVTPDPADGLLRRVEAQGIAAGDVVVRSATRDEVPGLLAAAELGLSFIRPSYSKLASSPTKLGEYLAMGLPVVTNAGVGDVERIVERVDAGIAVADFSAATYQGVVDRVPALLAMDPQGIRDRASRVYDLRLAVEQYAAMYRSVLGARAPAASAARRPADSPSRVT